MLLQFELEEALHEENTKRAANETKSQVTEAVVSLRFPKPVLTPEYEQRVLAIDLRTYHGPKEALESAAHQRRWTNLLSTIEPVHPYWVRNGEALWNELGLQADVEKTQELLALNEIDEPTARAIQVALFAAFNSSGLRVDMDTLILALSAFIHVHPDLKVQVKELELRKRFGSSTAYIAGRVLPESW
jgi:hypothetical protein